MTTEVPSLRRVRTSLATSAGPVALDDAQRESRAALNGGTITVLEHAAAIRVGGAAAQSFLQGQLSCDVNALAAGGARWGAWCTARGRVRAVVRVCAHDDALYLEIEREMSASTITGLGRYVLRADVDFEPDPEHLVRLGVAGEAAAELLSDLYGRVPSNPDEATQPAAGMTLQCLRGPHPRFEVWSDPEHARRLWSLATEHLTPVGTAAWRLLDIAAGLPTIYRSSSDRFLPQMLNLDALGGVSFTKGCYPGQEVVARTQHLGRVKRRLYVARAPAPPPATPPVCGAAIVAADGGSSIGEVLDAVHDPRGGWLLSTVLNVATANVALCLDTPERPFLSLQALPYGIPDSGPATK